jgi:hypothetical protein
MNEFHSHHDYADRNHGHGDLENLVAGLREDLGRAEARIYELETRLHDHEQAVPHAESMA